MLNKPVTFSEEITKQVDEASVTNVIYMDFLKAVDNVLRERLILKLLLNSTGNNMNQLILQWLTDRRQRVVASGEVSNGNQFWVGYHKVIYYF